MFEVRASRRWGIVLVAVTVAGCTGPVPPTPTAPAPPPVTVSGLTIGGLPASVTVGQAVQLTASVVLPDGTHKQTLDATWRSSDITVATISTTGILKTVAAGPTDITATAYGHSTSTHVRVPFRISGVVHESAPTANVAVADAHVEVQGGTDAGKSATTDSSGRFALDVEASGFSIVVTKSGYDPTVAAIEMLPRDQQPDIAVAPTLAMKKEVLEGTLYPECNASLGAGDASRDFDFAVHHKGTVTLEEFRLPAFEYHIDLYRGDDHIFGLGQCFNSSPSPQCPVSIAVEGGFRYRFRINAVYCQSTSTYELVFTHPN